MVCWRTFGAPAQLCWSWNGHRPDQNWHVKSRHTWSNVTENEIKFTVYHKTAWLCEIKERLSKVPKRTVCGLVQNCYSPSPKIHTVHTLTTDGSSQTVSVSVPAQTVTCSKATLWPSAGRHAVPARRQVTISTSPDPVQELPGLVPGSNPVCYTLYIRVDTPCSFPQHRHPFRNVPAYRTHSLSCKVTCLQRPEKNIHQLNFAGRPWNGFIWLWIGPSGGPKLTEL